MRRILLGTLMIATLALAAPAHARLECPPTRSSARLTVSFFGVSTILLKAGNEAIMIDGFFSRPGVLSMFSIRPKRRLVRRGLKRAGLSHEAREGRTQGARLRAVLVAQAHHDHSMDAALVARLTGATLVGSPSTEQVAHGMEPGLADIETVVGDEQLCFGPFGVRVILSPHSPGRIPGWLYGETLSPVLPGSSFLAFRDTRNFSFLVTYGDRRILIHPSANFPPGWREDRRTNLSSEPRGCICADLVFLSVGDLGGGRTRQPYIRDYWNAVVLRSRTRLVIPIHWDNFFELVPDSPAAGAQQYGLPRPQFGHQYRYAMREIRRLASDKVAIRFLDAFVEEDVGRLLASHGQSDPNCPEHAETS